MACYAIVIRIAQEDNYSNEVAVHFYKLDRLQRINLVQGLANKMDTKKFNLNNDNDRKMGDHFFYLTLMFFSILSWLVLMNLYL